MSSSNPVTRPALPTSIRDLLRRVRLRLRRDAMASGLLFFVCCAAIVFWTTTTLDAGWFQLQKLELPVGLRAILLAVLLPCGLLLLARRVIFPLVRRIRDSDIALLVERRFPQFQDRLITSVESSHRISDEGPLVKPMLERSVREADALAGDVAADDVFDTSHLKRLGLMSGGLMLSVACVGIVSPQSLTRWWSAFVRCDEIYHQRTTDLVLHAVSQPSDRRLAFQTIDQRLTYRHPRGADLELEMIVPDGGPQTGQMWVVPDRVRIDVIRVDGSRSRTYVSASSARTFRFVVTRLQEPVQIELLAGDYRTRVPYQIVVVNPPGIDAVELRCTYPEYTGWNQLRERTLTMTGSEVQLPVGTSFELVATSSKPLQAVRIVSDHFELSGDRDSSQLLLRDEQTSAKSDNGPLLSRDGRMITTRMMIVPPVATTTDPAKPIETTTVSTDNSCLQIPFSANLRFFLHDDDDVMSASPETLSVQGIPDAPPLVVAQMNGVGNAVTRLARIPVSGRIRDDYGLQSAGFEFLVDDESTWRPRPFRRVPTTHATDFDLQRSDDEPFEIFDLQPLELSEGQTLTLSVVASDDNQMLTPAVTRSEPLLFRIVSNEEVLSLLYTREISLRNRFEEVIAQLEQIRNDLQFQTDVARRVDAAGAAASLEDRASLNTSATRSGNNVRRQTNELNSIVEGFEQIVQQLENNAIPPQQQAEEMRATIVRPLQNVSGEMMATADRAVSAFRVAALDTQPTETLVIRSSEKVSDVIASLKLILDSVRDMAEFHELLKEGKAIEDKLEQLMQNMKDLQKRELLQKLKGI
ncbi:MAG: hypothetical protein NTX48_18765 [Planctomycetales bacterium]|nr:hypothetical protein [Planctomycetales bacterium]